MKIQKLAVQLHTVKPFMQTEKDVEESLKKIKALGYDQAQTAKMFIPYDTFGELADKAGIEIIGTHDPLEAMRADFDDALARHRALGALNMGIGHYKFTSFTPECVKEFADIINGIGEKLRPHGMKFTFHNHHREFIRLTNGRVLMDQLLEYLDPETVSIVLDTYWVQYAGGDVAAWIRKMAGRIDILHLKDLVISPVDQEPHFAEVGSGNMNWDAIMEAASESGVKYYAVEQDICEDDPFECLKRSSEYIHKNFM